MSAAARCGRSDCRAAATVEVLARSESGRTWVARSCEEHWAAQLVMVEALGFVLVGSVSAVTGVPR